MYAGHNYLLNVGSGYSVVQAPSLSDDGLPNGSLLRELGRSFAGIPDGTSQTVAISETIRSTAGAPTGFSGPAVFAAGPTWRIRHHRQQHGGQRPADRLG